MRNESLICKLLLTGFMLASASAACAKGEWKLCGVVYNADTVYHETVVDGLTQTHITLKAEDGTQMQVFTARVDMKNSRLRMRSFSGFDRSAGLEPISKTMQRAAEHGSRFVCGANADFFSFETGEGMGAQIMQGNVLCTELWKDAYYVGVTHKGEPRILYGIDSHLTAYAGGDTLTIGAVNRKNTSEGSTLYTSQYGASTGAPACPELVLKPKRHRTLGYGRTISCRPVGYGTQGNTAIPEGSIVISGQSSDADLLSRLSRCSSVKVKLTCTHPEARLRDMEEMVGGSAIFFRNGKVEGNIESMAHLKQRHPRTAMGYSEDRRYVTFMVVDGRSKESAGMTCTELADALREAGCSEALNLDGGGSSSLQTCKGGILNVPSDGSERAVTNGIGIVMKK